MELYRAKLKRTGDWFVGAVVCINGKAYGLVSDGLFPERPAYSRMAIGYGLRDKGIVNDGAKGAELGWEQALRRYEDNFPQWEELEPETVTRCTGKHDKAGNVLFEGDVVKNQDGRLFEICYGEHSTYCPVNHKFIGNVGFFMLSESIREQFDIDKPVPLGPTEEYAYLVGNVFDTLELRQAARNAGEWANQDVLMTAT